MTYDDPNLPLQNIEGTIHNVDSMICAIKAVAHAIAAGTLGDDTGPAEGIEVIADEISCRLGDVLEVLEALNKERPVHAEVLAA
jgi:hypothetical protein